MEETRPVTTSEVAKHFGVAASTVRKWVRDQRIPFIRISRKTVRFHLRDVEFALSNQPGGEEVSDGK